MTDNDDCYQNTLAKRKNGILKQEFLLDRPQDFNQARIIIAESIGAYNRLRPHLSSLEIESNALHKTVDGS